MTRLSVCLVSCGFSSIGDAGARRAGKGIPDHGLVFRPTAGHWGGPGARAARRAHGPDNSKAVLSTFK
jgi:hypothetical protein